MEKNFRHTDPLRTPVLDSVNKAALLYQVPHDYFEGLPDEIMARVRLENCASHKVYQVPEGYFSGLADQIMQRIHSGEKSIPASRAVDQQVIEQQSVQEELALVAPSLLQISNQPVYSVPAGYFEQLQPLEVVAAGPEKEITTLEPTHQNKTGKIIPLPAAKRIWRTAVAAAAIVVVLFSGERYFSNQRDAKELPVSSNQFASKINSAHSDSFNADLSELTEEEIMGYLSTPDPGLKDTMSEQAARETQKAISSMTNEELESYLERTPVTY